MARVASASSASKERLERISHHFLSGPGDGPAPGARTPVLVPVVAVPGCPEFPLDRLSQALLARGRPAVVLDARRDARGTSRPSPSDQAHRDSPVPSGKDAGGGGPTRSAKRSDATAPAHPAEAVEAARALDPVPDVCLVPLAADAWPLPGAFTHPLLVLPATTDGVREAYLCAKQAHAWGLTGAVGVIVVEAPDDAAAARHFDALSDALWRFLGLAAISYGSLPSPPPPHGPVDLLAPGGAQGDPVDAALAGMARLLAAELPEPEPEAAPAPAPRPANAARSKTRQAT
jgi:hypothetical protein